MTDAGAPAEGLVLPADVARSASDAARLGPLLSSSGGELSADAVFRVGSSPVIVFKSSLELTNHETEWHRLAWNFGVAPLLWVTTPQYVRLYNAFQPPESYKGGESPLLREFRLDVALDRALVEVAHACGRRHVSMGSFWRSDLARRIDRRSRIDNVLIDELTGLLRELVSRGIRVSLAQKLVGRCIFFQYLVHRGYVTEAEMEERFGAQQLHKILTSLDGTFSLFTWIRTTFNGDLFPIEDEASEREQLGFTAEPLLPLSDFFGHFTINGQGRLFPFRFDVIPVELISSIYEKFVHMSETDGAPRSGVHYTPINLVDLALDPLFEGLPARARVLDPACGSGVFLVESLRRLVWLRAQTEPQTRELVRDVLTNQICGVDISPAALSVAAFSLYLALLELDPSPPRGLNALDCLRFEPLIERVLFATSAFNPALLERIASVSPTGQAQFDVIVGNPPWTYSAKEKENDREFARKPAVDREDEEDEKYDGDLNIDFLDHAGEGAPGIVAEDPELRSGTTYARLAGLPIPPRSTDWPFLWRCRDFRHEATRIALVMKATPFFSLDANTSAGRDEILRAFPNVSVINLSQLRLSRLFQEYEGETNSGARRKKAAGPALLFTSNTIPAAPGTITAFNFPWTSDFHRTGVFVLPAEPAAVLSLDEARAEPWLMKAALFGTERDVWFLGRLARSGDVVRLETWAKSLKLPKGQGYQKGSAMESAHLFGLDHVTARDLRSGHLPAILPEFSHARVHRNRDAEIFHGPLVLLPEGRLSTAPARGRYTAAFDLRDLAYNESFIGVSFRGRSPDLARAFMAVMHSALVAYQVALLGGTVGVKQTKIEGVDLDNVRIPHIENLPDNVIRDLSVAAEILASGADKNRIASALAVIDQVVNDAAHLTDADRELLVDVDRRGGAILFETSEARRSMEIPPTHEELNAYARNLCLAFNAFAAEDDDFILMPDQYTILSDDLVVVKCTLAEFSLSVQRDLQRTSLSELGEAPLKEFGGHQLPYLKPASALRLYADRNVYIFKPAQYRYFSPAAGQSDGDRIVADLMYTTFPQSDTEPA